MNERKRITVSLTKSQVDFIQEEMRFIVDPAGLFVLDVSARQKVKRIITILERAITEDE